MTLLVTPAGRFDRRAVMTEAHRQFRLMRRYGWSFGRYLSFAWAKAREQRARLHAASLTVYCPRQKATLLARGDEQAGCFFGRAFFSLPGRGTIFAPKPLTVVKGEGPWPIDSNAAIASKKSPRKTNLRLCPLLRARFGKPSTKRIHAPSAPERNNCEGFPTTRRHEAARPRMNRRAVLRSRLQQPANPQTRILSLHHLSMSGAPGGKAARIVPGANAGRASAPTDASRNDPMQIGIRLGRIRHRRRTQQYASAPVRR